MSLVQSTHHTPPDSPRALPRSAMDTKRDPSRVVDSLVDAIRDLAADENYKVIADVFKDARDLRTENLRLASSHRDVLEEYRRFRNELEDREDKLLKEKQALEHTISQKDDKIKKLEEKKERLNAEVDKGKQRLDDESQKCLLLGEKVHATDAIVKNLQDQLQTKTKQLDKLAETKSLLDADLTETREILEQKTKTIEDLEAVKAELDDRLSAATVLLEEKDNDLVKSKQFSAATEAELTKLKESVNDKTKEAERLAAETVSLAEGIAAANLQLADKSKEAKNAMEENGHINSQLLQTHTRIEDMTRELGEVSKSKMGLEADLADTRMKLEEKQSEAASLSKKWEEANSSLDAKSREAQQLLDGKVELDVHLKRTVADLDAHKEAIQSVSGELHATKEALQLESEKANILLDDLVALRASAQDQEEEIGQLKGTVAEKTKDFEEAQLAIRHLRDVIESLERDLKSKAGKLDEIKRYQRELNNEPEDNYVDILDTIWVSILELVEKHFSEDLEDSVLRDASCWTNLRSSEYLKHAVRIPLPQSNSQAAKQMRIAAVLAVLSRALSKHIFRPVYLIENDVELAAVLRSLEAISPQQEYHARSTLLAVLPDREKRNAARRVKAVVREVSWLVQHLLSALQYEAFCTALLESCELACRQWNKIQHAAMKIEPYFGPPFDDFDWQVLLLPEKFSEKALGGVGGAFSGSTLGLDAGSGTIGGDARLQQDSPSALSVRGDDASSITAESIQTVVDPVDIMLVLWPSMCAVEGGELVSITQGLVMAKEQANVAFDEEGRRKLPQQQQRRARSMSTSTSRKSSPRPSAVGKAFLSGVNKADGDASLGGSAVITGSAKDGIAAS